MVTSTTTDTKIKIIVNSKFQNVAVFVVVFAIYSVYLRQPTFIDEIDNLLGGQLIAHGKIPYLQFYSQHTPLAYFASAAGFIVGAKGIIWQRVFFYFLFSLCLTYFYSRYSKYFGKIAIFIAVIFLATYHSANPDLSYAILSDHIEAIAFVFLSAEFLLVAIVRKKLISSWLVISIASFIAVGVAFVSAYFVAIAIIGSLLFDYLNTKKNTDIYIRETSWLKWLLIRVAVLTAPFLLLLIFFGTFGALDEMYEQAYLLNSKIYSKYIGGFGSDPIAPLAGAFTGILPHAIGVFSSLQGSPLPALRDLANLFFPFLLTIILLRRRPISAPFFVGLFAFSEMRGWHGFHAQPVWALSAFSAALVLFSPEFRLFNEQRVYEKSKTINFLKAMVAVLIAAFMILPWAKMAIAPVPSGGLSFSQHKPGTKEMLIETLVLEGGTYTDTSLDIMNFVETERDPAGGIGGIVPWFTEIYEHDFISKIDKDKPVIIFHDPNVEVWGYKLKDYAPDLNNYLLKNYTPISLNEADFNEGFFVRKDKVAELSPIIYKLFPSARFSALNKISQEGAIPSNPLLKDSALSQVMKIPYPGLEAIQVLTATYARVNQCSIKLAIYSESGEKLADESYPCNQIPDNGYLMFEFPEANIQPNDQITLRISSNSTSELNSIAIWENPIKPDFTGQLKQGNDVINASIILNLLYSKP